MTHTREYEPRGSRTRLLHVLIAFAAAGLLGFVGSATLRSLATDATTYTQPAEEQGTTGKSPAEQKMKKASEPAATSQT